MEYSPRETIFWARNEVLIILKELKPYMQHMLSDYNRSKLDYSKDTWKISKELIINTNINANNIIPSNPYVELKNNYKGIWKILGMQ